MTLQDIARFVAGPDAVTYAALCQEWHVDPADGVTDDPWLAWQLRLGLSDRLARARAAHEDAATAEIQEAQRRRDYELRLERARRQLGS